MSAIGRSGDDAAIRGLQSSGIGIYNKAGATAGKAIDRTLNQVGIDSFHYMTEDIAEFNNTIAISFHAGASPSEAPCRKQMVTVEKFIAAHFQGSEAIEGKAAQASHSYINNELNALNSDVLPKALNAGIEGVRSGSVSLQQGRALLQFMDNQTRLHEEWGQKLSSIIDQKSHALQEAASPAEKSALQGTINQAKSLLESVNGKLAELQDGTRRLSEEIRAKGGSEATQVENQPSDAIRTEGGPVVYQAYWVGRLSR